MTLGIVSDTHGHLPDEVLRVFAGVDLILHAGDIGPGPILERLEAVAPVRAVFGNIDDARMRRTVPEHQRFEAGGVRFWMTHVGGHPGRWASGIRAELQRTQPDVFVCGHSHLLRVERVPALGGLLYVNPGAAGRQGFHQVQTCLRLHLDAGRVQKAEVVELDDPRS